MDLRLYFILLKHTGILTLFEKKGSIMSKIGIIGLWHLGCVLSAVWSRLGHQVVGYDSDEGVVSNLKRGKPPLFEPELAETLIDSVEKGFLSYSLELEALADCDFVFLSYDTPVLDDDYSDTTILREAVDAAGVMLKDGAVLIVSSQSPVGFCSEMRILLKEKNETLELAYSPENLRLGEAIDCYLDPGRIILGCADATTEKLCRNLFSEIPGEIISVNLESAEIIKHGINSFLSTSIVFANHLADICEMSGACIDDVVRGMKSDPRIGEKAYLSAGIGFSGGTLGRDLKILEVLNRDAGGDAELFGSIHAWNIARKDAIVKRAASILDGLDGRKILLFGATYKPGTSTLRRSLPLEIAALLGQGGAKVAVYDPKADFNSYEGNAVFEVAASIEAGAESADMILLLTDWPEFRDQDWSIAAVLMKTPVIFDARNFLDEQGVRDAGLDYYSIGRSR